MLIDSKWVVKTTGGSEDLATSGTTAALSDYFDLKAVSGWADGGGEVFLVVRTKSKTAITGERFELSIQDSDASGGTYVSKVLIPIPLASWVADTIAAKIAIPNGIRQFVKVNIVSAGSGTMANVLTVNAAFVTE